MVHRNRGRLEIVDPSDLLAAGGPNPVPHDLHCDPGNLRRIAPTAVIRSGLRKLVAPNVERFEVKVDK